MSITPVLAMLALTAARGSADQGDVILVRNPAPSATATVAAPALRPVGGLSATELVAEVKTAEVGRKSSPKELGWAVRLGDLHLELARRAGDPDLKYAEASKALFHYEAAVKLVQIRTDQLQFEAAMAWAAYEVDRTEKVELYAGELLKGLHAADPGFALAQHEGHTLLGLLALDKNDLPTARAELIASGDVRRSPDLDARGPSLVLARRLLEKGAKDAVLDYLDDVAKFWPAGAKRAAGWAAAIRKGEPCQFEGARAD